MLDNDVEKRIMSVLSESRFGFSSTDIARKTGTNRVTVARYLDRMEANGLISAHNVGMAKVWMANKAPLIEKLKMDDKGQNLKLMLDSLDEGLYVIGRDLSLIWSNRSMQDLASQDTGDAGKCYDLLCKSNEACADCPALKTIKTEKPQRIVKYSYFKNGHKKPLLITTSPIMQDDKLLAVVILAHKLTQDEYKKLKDR